MSEAEKLIRLIGSIVIIVIVLWLLSEGYINMAIKFMLENALETLIIIIIFMLFLAYLSQALRKQ